MNIFEAIILGIIQGLTEFLPISSSGHLILAQRILGISPDLAFTLLMHVATLLAVTVTLRSEIKELFRWPLPRKSKSIIVACFPTAIVAGIIYICFRDVLDGILLAPCFLLTAALLLLAKQKNTHALEYTDAAIIGAAQGIAALPGLSRSGTTISVGVMLGLDRKEATAFSFLISIPVIIGSTAIELLNGGFSVNALPLIFGFISSFLSGLASAKLMMKLRNIDGFALYLVALGTFLILNDLFFHLF